MEEAQCRTSICCWGQTHLFSSKRLMRSDTLDWPPRTPPAPSLPPLPPPLPTFPSSMADLSGGFWLQVNGEVSTVTGLWRCSGFGGTREVEREVKKVRTFRSKDVFFLFVLILKKKKTKEKALQCRFNTTGGQHWFSRRKTATDCSRCQQTTANGTRVTGLTS